jgi:peptidoglycan/xylan/chitin deacetylase (PgdA/CDA1 family)
MTSIRALIGGVRRQYLCAVHSRLVPLGEHGPFVSFCFDDFPRSAYLVGGSILRSYGAHGTYYAATGLMNTHNELGDQMEFEDVASLLEDGHELGSHTFSHLSCRRIPSSKFTDDVQRGQVAIHELTGIYPASFAYPFGHVTAKLKRGIGKQMRSCRGIFGGINGPEIDLNLLRANSLYGDSNKVPEVKILLEQNERERGWLIFYTHDVSSTPSPFGCTPALLEECVYLATKSSASIATVKEVLDCLQ